MFDFLDNGAEQVITFDRTVCGCRHVKPKGVKRDVHENLFVTQSFQWVYLGGASGRNVAR